MMPLNCFFFFSSRFTICHKTEVVKNTLNPVWQAFKIPVRALCNGDYDRQVSLFLPAYVLPTNIEHFDYTNMFLAASSGSSQKTGQSLLSYMYLKYFFLILLLIFATTVQCVVERFGLFTGSFRDNRARLVKHINVEDIH